MSKFSVLIKSETCNYFDYDNCDKLLYKNVEANIPRIGETILIEQKQMLVTDIKRNYIFDKINNLWKEIINVYIIYI